MINRLVCLAVAIIITAHTDIVGATVTTYSTLTAFQAATTANPATAHDFSGFATSTPDTVTVANATFSSKGSYLHVFGPDDLCCYGTTAVSVQTGDDLYVTLSGGATAFAFDFATYNWNNKKVSILVDGATVASGVVVPDQGGQGTTAFFGIVSDAPINTMKVVTPAAMNTFEAVRFWSNSASSAAPEPESWALMLGGFGMIGLGVRRRRSLLS